MTCVVADLDVEALRSFGPWDFSLGDWPICGVFGDL